MRKQYFLLLDTETTQDSLVADFGALVVDRKGNIVNQCAILVHDIYNAPNDHPLFYTSDPAGLWSKSGLVARYDRYNRMLNEGIRSIATVRAINQWLTQVNLAYSPILTAYNLPFDLAKCQNTAIDLNGFDSRFCLWNAAYTAWAFTKGYRNFALKIHAFNKPTEKQNMTFKTNAETMARFVLGSPFLEDEPHTALEDCIFYELPVLKKLCKSKSTKWLLTQPKSYNWRDCQVNDWFEAN